MLPVPRLLILCLFLLSGAAALVYQVSWQRLLVIFAGGDVAAVTIITTAFMAGLGVGSLIGGFIADRISARGNLILFAFTELGIGTFGIVSNWFFQDVLYERLAASVESRFSIALLLFLCLLPPTILMGASLPILGRLLSQNVNQAASWIGRLYAINTLGAGLGAAMATWGLLPLWGIPGALRCASSLNLLCALAILPGIWRYQPFQKQVEPEAEKPLRSSTAPGLLAYLTFFFISGAAAMSAEIVWLRLLGAMAKASAHTMGTLLSIYLLGLGSGALVTSHWAQRSREPWLWYLRLHAGATLYAASGIALLLGLIQLAPESNPFRTYLASYEPVGANTAILLWQQWTRGELTDPDKLFLWIYPCFHLAAPLLVIFPATFLMGAAFPLLQRAAQSDSARIGRRIGLLQSANILGCMAGSGATTTILLPLIGSAGVLRILAFTGIMVAAFAIPRVLRYWIPMALGGILLMWRLPDQEDLWSWVHGSNRERIVLAEDGSGVSVIKRDQDNGKVWIYVNGIGQSWIPYGGIHSLLGALPVLLHPSPQRVALIGLGSGDTLHAMLARTDTHELVCAEIVAPQTRTLQTISEESGMNPVRKLFTDPRIQFYAGDGRMRLLRDRHGFDIIEADALRPDSAHAGTLYSEEYFRLLANRIRPGGMAVTWLPTQRVAETMVRVFPHVTIFGGMIGIGTMDPLQIRAEEVSSRIQDPQLQLHFQNAGIDLQALIGTVLGPKTQIQMIGPEFDRSLLKTEPNTDGFPRDEFSLPSLWNPAPN